MSKAKSITKPSPHSEIFEQAVARISGPDTIFTVYPINAIEAKNGIHEREYGTRHIFTAGTLLGRPLQANASITLRKNGDKVGISASLDIDQIGDKQNHNAQTLPKNQTMHVQGQYNLENETWNFWIDTSLKTESQQEITADRQPRKPNAAEMAQLAQFLSQHDEDFEDNEAKAIRVVSEAYITVFDNYCTSDMSWSGKVMLVMWGGNPSNYEAYAWEDSDDLCLLELRSALYENMHGPTC